MDRRAGNEVVFIEGACRCPGGKPQGRHPTAPRGTRACGAIPCAVSCARDERRICSPASPEARPGERRRGHSRYSAETPDPHWGTFFAAAILLLATPAVRGIDLVRAIRLSAVESLPDCSRADSTSNVLSALNLPAAMISAPRFSPVVSSCRCHPARQRFFPAGRA